jgi:hypothetical protein
MAEAGPRPIAIAIKQGVAMTLAPGVKQGTCRASVKARHGLVRNHAEIGNAAQIQNESVVPWFGKDLSMKQGHQGCPMPTQRDIIVSKVAAGGNVAECRQSGAVQYLKGIAVFRPMPDGLAMGANGEDFFVRGLFLQSADRISIKVCKVIGSERGLFNGIDLAAKRGSRQVQVLGACERRESQTKGLGHVQRNVCQGLGACRATARLAKASHDPVDTVEARARHQADENSAGIICRHSCRLRGNLLKLS